MTRDSQLDPDRGDASQFAELSAELQGRIDELCDRFEEACKSGATPVIEHVLPSALNPAERLAVLRELVPLDIAYRQRVGEVIFAADYLRRFPELHGAWLDGLLGAQTEVAEIEPEPTSGKQTAIFEPPPVEQFLRTVAESLLLTDEELRTTLEIIPNDEQQDSMALARALVRREKLTKFQAQMLLRGKPKGLVLGDYVVLDLLGRGGMGAVYRARHRRMERIVALKVLPPSLGRDRQLSERFRREVKAAARLAHRNVVAAFDAGEQHGILYLVMEFVAGQNLAALVKSRGAMSVAEAVDVIQQAAAGLAYAHEQGVIHRDIKPANLMLVAGREGGGVKVLDMGLARFGAEAPIDSNAATGLTRSGMLIGTAEYMAPEQAINVRQADLRADIYSLGATLYFLLTGRHMFSGSSFLEIVMAHQMMPVPSLRDRRADVPRELDLLFQRMVAKQPQSRPNSMAEIVAELNEIAELGLSTQSPQWRGAADNRPSSLHNPVTEEFETAASELGDAAQFDVADAPSSVAESDAPTQTRSLAANVDGDNCNSQYSEPARLAGQQRSRRGTFSTNKRRSLNWMGIAVTGIACVLIVGASINRALRPAGGVNDSAANTANSGASSDRHSDKQQPQVRGPRPELAVAPFFNPRELQASWARYLGTEDWLQNSIDMKFQLIPPGEFLMGTSQDERRELLQLSSAAVGVLGFGVEMPQHPVRITRPFWMGRHEVTVSDFRKFVEAERYITDAEKSSGWGLENNQWVRKPGYYWRNLGEHETSDQLPAGSISFNDATAFCEWLTRKEGVTYRLPTEAEWEWACRAGRSGQWPHPEQNTRIEEHAWFQENSRGRLHVTESRPEPNGFVLFDMIGNESEWCSDFFDPNYYRNSPVDDPHGPESGTRRVQRGGAFDSTRHQLRFAARDSQSPESPTHGAFRVVREASEP